MKFMVMLIGHYHKIDNNINVSKPLFDSNILKPPLDYDYLKKNNNLNIQSGTIESSFDPNDINFDKNFDKKLNWIEEDLNRNTLSTCT